MDRNLYILVTFIEHLFLCGGERLFGGRNLIVGDNMKLALPLNPPFAVVPGLQLLSQLFLAPIIMII